MKIRHPNKFVGDDVRRLKLNLPSFRGSIPTTAATVQGSKHSRPVSRSTAGFTMVEIALCLAIIGFALISILLVLPTGMHTQRDTRQQTIIDQDASMLIEAIRGRARGMDDLTNYVYAITNYWGYYDNLGNLTKTNINGYTYTNVGMTLRAAIYNGTPSGGPYSPTPLTNGFNIVGELSTPLFVADLPGQNYPVVPSVVFASKVLNAGCYSNHIIAYVRAFSGLAAEKPPEDNAIMQGDTFSYRVVCVNAPTAVDPFSITNPTANTYSFARELAANVRDLRLLFMWPSQPNGDVGPWRQNFRTSVAGQLILTNALPGDYPLFFYQSQSFDTNSL